MKPNTADDAWRFVERGVAAACWPWTSAVDGDGYGLFKLQMVQRRAARVICELAHGSPSPGACAMHSCDNPICCNPDHLRWGTIAENNAERARKGRNAKTGPGAAKLTPASVCLIRRLFDDGDDRRLLAARFGVTEATLRAAVRQRTWKHVR